MSLERAQEQLETNINCWLKTGRHVQVATAFDKEKAFQMGVAIRAVAAGVPVRFR